MRAGDGAIESVLLEKRHRPVRVIGDMPPQESAVPGSSTRWPNCSAAACWESRVGLRAKKSRHFPQPLGQVTHGRRYAGICVGLCWRAGQQQDIVITQKDIRELQLARAAIAAGIAVLLKEVKIEASQIDRIYLAGAFGNYLDRGKGRRSGHVPRHFGR